jgi:protein-disulfide isomerase
MMHVLRTLRARWPAAGAWLAGGALLLLAVGLLALLTGRQPSEAANGGSGALTKAQRAEVEAIVRDYILAHPEIIPEAVSRLQAREVTSLINQNRTEIETPFKGAWAGARDGDVTLVEFFDYNCPYCRLSHPDVERLLKEDKKLKVVYRDLPVLGDASREAALASLSAAEQGRYRRFYTWMFRDKARVSTQKTIQGVRAAGLNEVRTARDMKSARLEAEIEKNLRLGGALGLTGTPSYVIGDRILSGAVGYDELKQAVAEARDKG